MTVEGTDLTLSCRDPGNTGITRYQWFDNNGSSLTAVSTNPPLTLSFTNIQRNSSGLYICQSTEDNVPGVIILMILYQLMMCMSSWQFLTKCINLKRTSCDLVLLFIYCFIVKSGHNPVYETIQPDCDEDTTVEDTQQTSNNSVKSQPRPDSSMVPNEWIHHCCI